MCAVSYIGDMYTRKINDDWAENNPWIKPHLWPDPSSLPPMKPSFPPDSTFPQTTGPTREEFDELKKMVLEMKDVLKAAKEYDDLTGQPHCEHDDKVDLLKKLADAMGVDLGEVFDND